MQECYLCGIKYTTLYFLMIVAKQKWKDIKKDRALDAQDLWFHWKIWWAVSDKVDLKHSCGGHIGLLGTLWISFLVAMTLIWFSSFLGYHTHLSLACLCWQVKYHHTITLPCPFNLAGWSVATEEKRKTIGLLLKARSGTERLMQAVGWLHFSKRLVAT